jgi:type IV secretion system protein VirD4
MTTLRPLLRPWKSGKVYLGRDPLTGMDVGLRINRQALTIAGQGAGKGTCQIIPNLFAWPHSAVVIDPSGEAAVATARHRAATFGHQVVVFDPFNELPDLADLRGAINPLDYADAPDDFTDLAASLVPHGDAQDSHWNNSARSVCAGLLAYIKTAPEIGDRHRFIPQIRTLVARLHDNARPNKDTPSRRETLLGLIAKSGEFAATKTARLRAGTNEVASILSALDTPTEWLDSPAAASTLVESSFNLNTLKNGRLTVYLVIPPTKLDAYGRYLRLLVRFALGVMFRRVDGQHKDKPCLFLLDEFAALGRMDDLRAALPQGRKHGLHIWPFVQNFGQLEGAYGKDKAQEFLSSTDFVSYFGIDDPQTLHHLAERLGTFTEDDFQEVELEGARDLHSKQHWWGAESLQAKESRAITQGTLHAMRGLRHKPEDVQRMLAPKKIGAIASRMLVYTPQGWLTLQPGPYFAPRSGIQSIAFLAVILLGYVALAAAHAALFYAAYVLLQKHTAATATELHWIAMGVMMAVASGITLYLAGIFEPNTPTHPPRMRRATIMLRVFGLMGFGRTVR